MSLEARIVAVLEAIGLDMGAVQAGKVDKVSGKQLSTEDFTSAEKTKLGGIAAGAQVNTVTSVAGRTGGVVLAKADVGLGNVDNTADSAKPVSTAQQTALNLKANLASPALTGTPTAPTAADGTSTTQIATTAFVQGAVGGFLSKTTTGGTTTLTTAEASNPIIKVSGTLTANAVLEIPVEAKRSYSIENATTGAFTLTVKHVGLTPSVLVAQGKRNIVMTNGVGAYDAINDFESISLTGVPTTTTAAANTNTTQVASTAFVLGQAATATPAALGTAAVGNSTRFARENHVHAMPTLDALTNVTITSNANGEVLRWNGTAWVNNTLAEAGIAPVASPALTGTPTAPTAGDGTNTTQVATTAFVQNAVGGYLAKAVTGGTVTLTDTEASNPVIALTGALTSALIVVVPTTVKRLWAIYNSTSGAFTVTVKTAAGTGVTVAQGKRKLVYTDGTNVYDGFNDFESVALTGTPTAPTAAANTNTTQVATTAFVLGQAATAAPQALGAAAVGNATRFARENHVHAMPTLDALANTTITSNTTGEILRWDGTAWVNATLAEAGIAPVVSPALTGTPTAPTAAAGTNTTQVATTAFVRSAVSTSSTTFASAAENAAGTVQNKAVDPLGIREAFNATGSAPVYACRAWVSFGAAGGTPAIRSSGNVSSITDNGVGLFTINFTTAMPDANYAPIGSCSNWTGVANVTSVKPTTGSATTTTTACQIICSYESGTIGAAFDAEFVSFAVFR